MNYDVLIIGGGAIGCMIAYRLTRYKLKTALVEAESDLACGISKINSAIVHAGYDALPGTKKALLNVKGSRLMPTVCRELGVPYKRCGSLAVAFDDEEEQTLNILFDRGTVNGVKGLDIIGVEQLREMEPGISKDAVAALYAPTAGIVCPYKLAIAAAENAAINGTAVLLEHKAVAIKRFDGFFAVTLSHNGEESTVRARYVVNAAGISADSIARLAGESEPIYKIIPRRSGYIMLDKNTAVKANRPLFTVSEKKENGTVAAPTADGKIIFGSTVNETDCKENTANTAELFEEIKNGAAKLLPDVDFGEDAALSAEVVAASPNGDFVIEESKEIKGFIHVGGIDSPGIAASPAIADYVVSILSKAGLELFPNEVRKAGRPQYYRFRDLPDEKKALLIKKDPAYANIICKCETVTEGEIIAAVNRPIKAVNIDMVKRRTGAVTGLCGGSCMQKTAEIVSRETGISAEEILKKSM